jgi:hypothetical protein
MPRSRRKRGRSRPFSIKAAHPLRSSRVRRSFVRRHRIRRSQHPEFATAVLRSRSALPEFRRSQTVSIKTATRETGSVSNLCQNFFRIFFCNLTLESQHSLIMFGSKYNFFSMFGSNLISGAAALKLQDAPEHYHSLTKSLGVRPPRSSFSPSDSTEALLTTPQGSNLQGGNR